MEPWANNRRDIAYMENRIYSGPKGLSFLSRVSSSDEQRINAHQENRAFQLSAMTGVGIDC